MKLVKIWDQSLQPFEYWSTETSEGDVLGLDLFNSRDDGVWSEPRNVDRHCVQAKFSEQINKFISLVGVHPSKKTQKERLHVLLEIRPGSHNQ